MAVCTEPGCGGPVSGRGLCSKHYQRLRRTATGKALINGRGLSEPEKFLRFVERGEGCWLWTGKIGRSGYGYFALRGGSRIQTTLAHRWSYTHFVGPIPEGLYLDHLCLVKHCVNPAHLEPVTPSENSQRHYYAKTTCKNGHPLEGDNLQMRGPNGTYRICRACAAENTRRHRQRQRHG
jgi:hypothetical protein